MGYSVSINCVSQQKQCRMLKFLEKNFRHWGVVNGGSPDDDRYISDPLGHLSYAQGKNQIGFDYGAWGGDSDEREYYFATLRWAALQVGLRRQSVRMDSSQETHEFAEPVPTFIYDGYDHWPVLVAKPIPKLSWCWVDRLGMVRDKDVVADRYRTLIWEHLILPLSRKKGEESRFTVDARIFEILGIPPQDKVPVLSHEVQVKIVRKLLWPEVVKCRKPIKDELTRLNGLWRAEN